MPSAQMAVGYAICQFVIARAWINKVENGFHLQGLSRC